MTIGAKALAVAITLLATAALALGCGGDDDDGGRTESGRGFELTLPDGWSPVSEGTTEEVGKEVDEQIQQETGILAQVGPLAAYAKDPEDGFATNVNVILEEAAAGMSLERYQRVSEANAASLGAEVEQGYPRAATLGGEPAFEIVATQNSGGRQTRAHSYTAMRPEGPYTVTLTALPAEFDDDDQEFTEIVESFRFTD